MWWLAAHEEHSHQLVAEMLNDCWINEVSCSGLCSFVDNVAVVEIVRVGLPALLPQRRNHRGPSGFGHVDKDGAAERRNHPSPPAASIQRKHTVRKQLRQGESVWQQTHPVAAEQVSYTVERFDCQCKRQPVSDCTKGPQHTKTGRGEGRGVS